MKRQVKLVTQHTHAGVLYNAGQTIEMEIAEAEWYTSAVIQQRADFLASPAAKILKAVASEPIAGDKKESK